MNQTPETKSVEPKKAIDKNMKIGIALIAIIVVVTIVIIGIIFATGDSTKNNENQENNHQNSNDEESRVPVLENLGGIEFGDYDVMTGRAGSFIFDKDALSSNWPLNKIFLEFGSTNVGKVFPELVYNQVDADTNVIALGDGKVVEVRFQAESNDYAFSTVSGDNWAINYDHVRNVTLEIGDMVKAGDIIGKVSLNKDGQTGFVEIAVKQVDQATNAAVGYCPLDLMASNVRAEYVAHFTKLMSDWEDYMQDKTIYNEANMHIAGCSLETLNY